MPKHDFDLGVIGGGAAGLTVTSGAARLGARVLLLEKDRVLGGDCLHFGCVPSKTLIATAAARSRMRRAADFGLPPVDLPPVDFARVRERIRSVIADIQRYDSVERFCALGAAVRFGPVRFLDEHTVETADGRVSAARWVLATGSSPGLPKVPGLDVVPMLTNRELFSLDRLPASLLILGGGPMAVEMGQAFARLGSRVTLVQRGPQILSREDPDMAAVVADGLRIEGVELLTGAKLLEVRQGSDGSEVDLEVGGGRRTVTAEALLVALGRDCNTAGLDLDRAGVEGGPQGVLVDARLRTNQPHIYAVGDITGRHQFTHAAGYEGGIAVANAVLRLPRRADYRLLPWCTYTEPELGGIGLNERRAYEQGIDCRVVLEEFRDNDRARAEGAPAGRLKLLLDRRGRPLGVQIAGPHAGEILGHWVAALGGRLPLATLASAVHPYPTLGEISKRAAGQVLAEKLFSGRVRKVLHLLFATRGRACGIGVSGDS